jgi:hypothetical protein
MSGVEAAIGFGASVLGIASAGIAVATTLIRFSTSYSGSSEKIEDLSSRVSLTATILTTVGNTIDNHKDYFKQDNFREKFGRVTDRCKKDYSVLDAALHRAKGKVEDVGLGSGREQRVRRLAPWKKLIWALGGEERMKDLQSSLEESKSQVLMMQSAASLIVLQIIGRR